MDKELSEIKKCLADPELLRKICDRVLRKGEVTEAESVVDERSTR